MFQLVYSESFQNSGEKSEHDREALPWQGWLPGSEILPCTIPLSPWPALTSWSQKQNDFAVTCALQDKKVLLETYLGKVLQNCERNLLLELQHLTAGLAW